MGKGRPFLEVLSSAIHEDFRFPFLELFAFLYALGAFASANFAASIVSGYSQVGTNEAAAYAVTNSLISGSLIFFLILVFKNVAYGLGSELEKGIIQTYFSYPLKRWAILTAKLLSGIGLSLLLFLGIQISAFYILAPEIVSTQLSTIMLTYAANLSFPLIISGIILLLTLQLRRGGIGLVVGVMLYIGMSIASALAFLIASATESALGVQILSVISPTYALQYHYIGLAGASSSLLWSPTLSETMLYLGGSYAIVAALFILAYIYFSRRLNL
jgi:ABC-type transport system involved in multi-copper enzyme maturation permease subunit